MNQQSKNELDKLYTVTFKCAHCMRILGSSKNQVKTQTGRWTKADFKPCPEHPGYGFVAEWEPQNDGPVQ